MAINPYYTVEEINGIRCSVVEKKASEDRATFLKRLLEHNKLNVQMNKGEDGLYIIGVDNILFNPVYSIYNRSMRTPEGKIMTAAYWFQKHQTNEYYWHYE